MKIKKIARGIALLCGLVQPIGCSDSLDSELTATLYPAALQGADPNVRIREALNCSDCDILNLSERMLPRLRKHLTAGKVLVPATGEHVTVALDENGTLVDLVALERQERIAERKERGALSDRLQSLVESANPQQSIRVRLSHFPELLYPPKELLIASPHAELEWRSHVARAERESEAVLQGCAERGGGKILTTLTATEWVASLPAWGLRRIQFDCDAEVDDASAVEEAHLLGDVRDGIRSNTFASITGTGVVVAVVEEGRPNTPWEPHFGIPAGGIELPGLPQSLHMTQVASVVRATGSSVTHEGIAHGASLIFGGNLDSSFPWAISKEARVINRSYWHGGGDISMSQIDYKAKQFPFPLFVSAAGNNEFDFVVMNWHMNGLIVGGANPGADPGNRNTYTAAGSWEDRASPHGDRELPDMVASYTYFCAINGICQGTSFAAPEVSGAAARLHQAQPALLNWPEGLRAILQATAYDFELIDGEVWQYGSGVDGRLGTGLLNVDSAIRATENRITYNVVNTLPSSNSRGFDFGTLQQGAPNNMRTYRLIVTPSGTSLPHFRVAVAFDAAPDSASGGTNILDADIDLDLRRDTDGVTPICHRTNTKYYSNSWDNSYEFIDCIVTNPDPNNAYRIAVVGTFFNRPSAWYGVAVVKKDITIGSPP